MQFDEFERKVKKAADHHHPAYDEQAWTKMEKLLNKHLPQKEDDKRRFFFLVLLFLGLGGAGLIIAKPWKSSQTGVAQRETVEQKQPVILPGVVENRRAPVTVNTEEIVVTPTAVTSSEQASFYDTRNNIRKEKDSRTQLNSQVNKTKQPEPVINAVNTPWQSNEFKASEPEKIGALSPAKNTNAADSGDPLAKNGTAAKPDPVNSEIPTKENQPLALNKTKKERSQRKRDNELFITLSAGPDASFVGKDKLGTTKLVKGAGLGYTFNKRFTIRGGFYSGRKVYTASPDAYNPPTSFYVYYPYLEKVEADCEVYEIPLSLSYNFSRSSKQNFFASVGVSSYLMKSEKYDYTYKYYPSGPTLKSQRIIDNKNKHYFSGLTLSGGYQRKISRNISLTAEPYVKLPMTGLGYGKVKLNSGGVLFSIGIKPFNTKNTGNK